MKEFNLSEMISNPIYTHGKMDNGILLVKHVKEFIKLLKDCIDKNKWVMQKQQRDWIYPVINGLAGERLK